MEEREERVVAVPQKANVTGFFIQQARRRQSLHSSPDSLARGPQEETFWKDQSPQPQAWKEYVYILSLCERGSVLVMGFRALARGPFLSFLFFFFSLLILPAK